MKSVGEWGFEDIAQFKGKKVFITPGAFYGAIVILFTEAGFEKAKDVEEADLVVFSGGGDVNPVLYKEKPISNVYFNEDRDSYEIQVYNKCIKMSKPMFGICRGAQFLHVMNGGTLWQDVDGHAGGDHLIYDLKDDVIVKSTSYHHQMLREDAFVEVLAVSEHSIVSRFRSEKGVEVVTKTEDTRKAFIREIEAGYHRGTKCFFVQGHPEVGNNEYKSWTMFKLQEFLESLEEKGNLSSASKTL